MRTKSALVDRTPRLNKIRKALVPKTFSSELIPNSGMNENLFESPRKCQRKNEKRLELIEQNLVICKLPFEVS